MNPSPQKRSGMLSMIYNMLPGIDNDYAAKLVYTLEDKKTLEELQQDIADLATQLNSDSPMTDTLIAKMMLDECTLAAALRQLRIYNNSTSITELCAALDIPAKDTSALLETYASFSTRHYFDEAFEQAVATVEDKNLTDEEKARKAIDYLLLQVQHYRSLDEQTISSNRTDIFKLADEYHLSVKLTAELELLYSQPSSILFKPEFERICTHLLTYNPKMVLCASLTARAMLGQITVKDAQDIALTSKLLNDELLEEDLLIIACRYLKIKTPQDIANAYDAVLKKLPYLDNPEENLGLAVRVLLDGTPDSLQQASQVAALKRETKILYRSCTKDPLYDGYEQELANRYAGEKTFEQLNTEMRNVLKELPHYAEDSENKELACKVLLGVISLEEACTQARYMQNQKAHAATQGLAPNLMKRYLGTKSAKELIKFFNKSLEPYTFWTKDPEKHTFALSVLVDELNGTYNQKVSRFVLDMLENGSSIDVLTDMLSAVRNVQHSSQDLQDLLERYRTARAETKQPSEKGLK